jgi:hypothetical protein
MELVKYLALQFDAEGIDYNLWPEDAVARQVNDHEVVIEGWKTGETYTYSNGRVVEYEVSFEPNGEFKIQGEYGDFESVDRDEFFAFMEANPTYVADTKAKRQEVLQLIAELNQTAYDAVEQAMALSRGADLPYSCRMPAGVANLDENSDWDSSRC